LRARSDGIVSIRLELAFLSFVLAIGCGGAPAGRGSPTAPAAAAHEGPASDEAPTDPETWPITLLRNEGVWSVAAPARSDTVTLLVRATQPQRGYDPMGTMHLVEARARGDLALRWRVLLPGDAGAIASSADGARLAVQLADRTRVLDASDGHTVRDVAGGAYLVAWGDGGELLRATREVTTMTSTVEVVEVDGTVRTFAVPGSAPSTIHAMRADGACEEIHTRRPVVVRALAASGGVLAIGAGDTSIRLHALGAATSVERRLTRTDVRTLPGDAVAPITLRFREPGELVAVYSDGAIVRWDVADGTRRATVDGACTPEELARIAVTPGLPADVVACGETLSAVVFGERVILTGGAGTRVLTLDGARLAAFPSHHMHGAVTTDEELWLAGTNAVLERWTYDGRFRGAARVGTGWSRVVALSESLVAIQGAREGEVRGQESEGPLPVRLHRIADGVRLPGFEDAVAQARFVGERAVVGLVDGSVAVREVEGARAWRELARFVPSPSPDAGLPVSQVPIVRAFENAVVLAGTRASLVTADSIDALGAAPPSPEAGLPTAWAASADGRRIARLVFDPEAFTYRLEVWSIGASTRRLVVRERVGEHVAISRDGTRVAVSGRGDAPMALLDASSGAELSVPSLDAAFVGFDALGALYAQGRSHDAPFVRVEGERLVPVGRNVLVPAWLESVGGRVVLASTGGGAHVLDGRGGIFAYVGAVDGDGFAIVDADGLVASSIGLHLELAAIEGGRAPALDAREARPARWARRLGR
jgi:hypothetical protein